MGVVWTWEAKSGEEKNVRKERETRRKLGPKRMIARYAVSTSGDKETHTRTGINWVLPGNNNVNVSLFAMFLVRQNPPIIVQDLSPDNFSQRGVGMRNLGGFWRNYEIEKKNRHLRHCCPEGLFGFGLLSTRVSEDAQPTTEPLAQRAPEWTLFGNTNNVFLWIDGNGTLRKRERPWLLHHLSRAFVKPCS